MSKGVDDDRARRALAALSADERASLGLLSPAACASALAVTGEFIRGEIRSGRLEARQLSRISGRTRYRIDASAFRRYVERYWPEKRTVWAESEV
jgi:hypothetical protein